MRTPFPFFIVDELAVEEIVGIPIDVIRLTQVFCEDASFEVRPHPWEVELFRRNAFFINSAARWQI